MRNVLRMRFITDANKVAAISIPNPFLNVADAAVKNAMLEIVTSGSMRFATGLPMDIKNAELVTAAETKFNV